MLRLFVLIRARRAHSPTTQHHASPTNPGTPITRINRHEQPNPARQPTSAGADGKPPPTLCFIAAFVLIARAAPRGALQMHGRQMAVVVVVVVVYMWAAFKCADSGRACVALGIGPRAERRGLSA